MDAQFADAVEEPDIPKNTGLEPHNPLGYHFHRAPVGELLQPVPKEAGLNDLNHM